MTVKRRGAQKQYSFQYYCSKAFIFSYFEKGCQKKCARATIPEGWNMINTLFLTMQLSNLLLTLSFSIRKHTSMASSDRAILSNLLKNSKLKTTHNTFRDCRVHFFPQPFSK